MSQEDKDNAPARDDVDLIAEAFDDPDAAAALADIAAASGGGDDEDPMPASIAHAGDPTPQAAMLFGVADAVVGHEASKPPEAPGPAIDHTGRLDEDITCRACGYNLRGCDPKGVCPECGTPAGLSLVGDLMQFADPRWARRLSRGSAWVIGSVVMGLAAVVALLGIAVAGSRATPRQDHWVGMGMALFIVPLAIQFRGYWLATSPEPARHQRGSVLRWLARYATVMWFITTCASLAWVFWLSSDLTDFGVGLLAAGAVGMLLARLFAVVSTITILGWASKIARRLQDARLRRACIVVMIGLILADVFAILSPLFPLFVLCWLALTAICSVWSVILMVQFRGRLRGAAIVAERTWARHSSAAEQRQANSGLSEQK